MWEIPPVFCPLVFYSFFASNTPGLNANCILHQIHLEIFLAQQDLGLICNETAMFSTLPKRPKSTRQRRRASMDVASLAAVGLFGGGLAAGGSDSGRLRCIFGNCQDQSQANAKIVRRLAHFEHSLPDYVQFLITELKTNKDEEFFLVENELAAFNTIQSDMAATQYWNWVIIQDKLAIQEQTFHILRHCDRVLFANLKPYFNFDTVFLCFQWFMLAWNLAFSYVRFSHEHFLFPYGFATSQVGTT